MKIFNFYEYNKILEDNGGVAMATAGTSSGMGAIVAPQPSSIPGDVAGSTRGSGDIAAYDMGDHFGTVLSDKKKKKKKKGKNKMNIYFPNFSNWEYANPTNENKENDEEEKSAIDGKSKKSAINLIYKYIDDNNIGKHIYSDIYWNNIKPIWVLFDDLNLNWDIVDSYYDKENPLLPKYKRWIINIEFTNNKGIKDIIHASITAHGAGREKDPLEKYDITIVLS